MTDSLNGKAAITGIGETEYSRLRSLLEAVLLRDLECEAHL